MRVIVYILVIVFALMLFSMLLQCAPKPMPNYTMYHKYGKTIKKKR